MIEPAAGIVFIVPAEWWCIGRGCAVGVTDLGGRRGRVGVANLGGRRDRIDVAGLGGRRWCIGALFCPGGKRRAELQQAAEKKQEAEEGGETVTTWAGCIGSLF